MSSSTKTGKNVHDVAQEKESFDRFRSENLVEPMDSDENFNGKTVNKTGNLRNILWSNAEINRRVDVDVSNYASLTDNTVSVPVAHVLPNLVLVCLDVEGNVNAEDLRIEDVARKHGLNLQDLRRCFSSWDKTESKASVRIKESKWLIVVFDLKCLVTDTCLLIFYQNLTFQQSFLGFVKQRLRRFRDSNIADKSTLYEEDTLREEAGKYHQEETAVPFQITVLQLVLEFTLSKFIADSKTLSKVAESLSSCLAEDSSLKFENFSATEKRCLRLNSMTSSLKMFLDDILSDQNECREFNFASRDYQRESVKNKQTRGLESVNESAWEIANVQRLIVGLNHSKNEKDKNERFVAKMKDMLEHYKRLSSSMKFQTDYVLDLLRVSKESYEVSLSLQRFQASSLRLKLSVVTFACALIALFAVISGTFCRIDLNITYFFLIALVFLGIISVLQKDSFGHK